MAHAAAIAAAALSILVGTIVAGSGLVTFACPFARVADMRDYAAALHAGASLMP